MHRVGLVLLALGASCVSGFTEADPRAVDLEVRRLLVPFQTNRGLVCDELLIEITANFNEMVGHPSVDPQTQRVTQQIGEGFVEYRWENLQGQLQSHFLIRILGTEEHPVALNDFAALRSARLRVFEGGQLTFRVVARGQVTVEEGAGEGRERRDMQEFRIEDGRVSGS